MTQEERRLRDEGLLSSAVQKYSVDDGWAYWADAPVVEVVASGGAWVRLDCWLTSVEVEGAVQ